MENPQLSCIIPIYNVSGYLGDCLDHILAADLGRLEIILIDDGSTDESRKIGQKYTEKYPFILMECQKNAGPSAARNRGLDLSRGEYVVFFDGDDYIDPDAFRKTMMLVRQYPEADLWVSDFRRVSDNGCVLDRVYQIDAAEGPIQGKKYLRRFLRKRGCVWNIWRYVFKREFLVDNGLRFVEGIDCTEDLEFVARALMKTETPAFFHEPYYFYRVNYGETLTRRYDARRVQHLTAMLQRSVRYLKEQRSDAAQIFLNKIVSEFFLNLALMWEVPPEERTQVRGLLRETAWIAASSDRHGLKLLGVIASGWGIGALSWVIYCLKCAKRRIRKAKTAHWAALERRDKMDVELSVVIPVFNSARFLRQCLDSILTQSQCSFEVICVEDHSADESAVILSEYQTRDERVRVIYNSENLGAGRCRNLGLACARGDYLLFVDSDDWLFPDSLEKVLRKARRHRADVLRCRAADYDDQFGTSSLSLPNALKKVPFFLFDRTINCQSSCAVFARICVAPWGGLFRREFLLKNDIRFNDLVCVNDRSFFWETILKAERIVLTRDFLVHYRMNLEQSLVGRRVRNFSCHFDSYRLVENLCRGQPERIRRRILSAELMDLAHWARRADTTEYAGSVRIMVKRFLDSMDRTPWGGQIEGTLWYWRIARLLKSNN